MTRTMMDTSTMLNLQSLCSSCYMQVWPLIMWRTVSGNAKQLISILWQLVPLGWGRSQKSPSAFKLVGLELDETLQKGVGYYSQALRNLTVQCHSNFLMLIHATWKVKTICCAKWTLFSNRGGNVCTPHVFLAGPVSRQMWSGFCSPASSITLGRWLYTSIY